jgi:hypothetical protein
MLWNTQIVLNIKGFYFGENGRARIAHHFLGAIPELEVLLREIFLQPNLLDLVLPDLDLVEAHNVGATMV